MKPSISRKIASLLLLFNLTGVFALAGVGWLVEQRSDVDKFRGAIGRQQVIVTQLRSNLAFLSTPTGGLRGVLVSNFEKGLLEIKKGIRSGSPSYVADPAISARLEDLEAKWTELKAALMEPVNDKQIETLASGFDDASQTLVATVLNARKQARNRRILYILAAACILNAGLFVLGTWLTRRYIIAPIQSLNQAVLSFQSGQLQEVPISNQDELANLGLAFNEMSRGIQNLLMENNRSTEALKASEARYRLLFDSNPSPIMIFDKETLRFLVVNQAAVDHYGYTREDFLSKTILDIRPSEDVPEALEGLRRDEVTGRLWRHKKRDGSIIHVRIAAHDFVFESRPARLAVVNDVSEQMHLEEQLRQSQKMEAIGRLSGGVAHDFNNILTVISGHVTMLMEDAIDPRIRSSVAEIEKAAQRAAGLTRQLLAFSRKQILQPKIVNLNRVVKSACEMIGRVIGEDIQIRTILSPSVTPVRIDPGEMEQVIVNLTVNARDAMPDGGTLTIETETVALEEHPEGPGQNFQPGQYLLLTVEDTGCGMDTATMSRIFDPFFTTKPVGKGTGLGLSTVYGIIKQSAGIITVDSKPGLGTRFCIYLPSAEAVAEQPDAVSEKPKSGSERILLVEDDPVVRSVAKEALKRLGYEVLSAGDVVTAQRLCAQHPRRIHLLLTDVIMPGMNGAKLARSLTKTRPDMQVLFMSGYTEDALLECGFSEESVHIIHKPFTFEQLQKKVRNVLDKSVAVW